MKMQNALFAFRWIFVVFIVFASAKTLLESLASPPVAILASTEILAALLFLFTRTERLACGALLVIFALACTLSVLHGEVPLRFVYYGATAMFIVACRRSLENAEPMRASSD